MTESMADLTEYLRIKSIEHPEELEAILLQHFSSAGEAIEDAEGPREVTYPGPPDDWAIKLTFDKNGRVVQAKRGSAATDSVMAAIKAEVESAILSDAAITLASDVCFSHFPQEGWFRYRDLFQILPMPADAPRPQGLMGEFPFLLEYSTRASPNPLVQAKRLARSFRETSLMLCGLSVSPIWALNGGRARWVVLPGKTQSQCCWEGYLYPRSVPKGCFSDPPAHVFFVPLVAPLELYSVYSDSAGLPFQLPDNIADLLDSFGRLPSAQRKRFLRASYWLQQATCLFLQSFSLSFLAAISAVEAMFNRRDYTTCSACGQRLFNGRSLTTMFVELLTRYLPLASLTDRGHTHRRPFEERLTHLYSRRSELTHGTSVMSFDEGHWLLDTIGQREDSDLRTLLRILPLALQNWLLEAARSEQERAEGEAV